MSGTIESFFFAWGAPDDSRDGMVSDAVAEDVTYRDPKGEVTGVKNLCDYVAQYSANAPGAAAEVVEDFESDEGRHAVRVRFFGEGWQQFGRYDVSLNDEGRISRIEGVAEKSE